MRRLVKGQTSLPAVAVALLLITTVAGLSVTIADASVRSAERDSDERATATATAETLIGGDSPLTERRNVLTERRIENETIGSLVPSSVDIRVAVDGRSVYERGDPIGGVTIRRIVLVADRQTVDLDTESESRTITLPRRSPRATISLDADANIETVRANGRILLYDPGGLDGRYNVSLSRYETTTLRVDGTPSAGGVGVTYYPRRTQKALLEVTVDG
jgi:hypothetical protein